MTACQHLDLAFANHKNKQGSRFMASELQDLELKRKMYAGHIMHHEVLFYQPDLHASLNQCTP